LAGHSQKHARLFLCYFTRQKRIVKQKNERFQFFYENFHKSIELLAQVVYNILETDAIAP